MEELFGHLCGREAGHVWAPGGELLLLCQRCTGLYAGAALAAVALLLLRPRIDRRFLWVHGAFLLLMIPFGFHLVPQGAVIRTVTGTLFGAGVVVFLWPRGGRRGASAYYAVLVAACAGLVLLGRYGGRTGHFVLVALSVAGLPAILVLIVGLLGRFVHGRQLSLR